MRRGTTPTISINATGETFVGSRVFVTIAQGKLLITKTGAQVGITPDIDHNSSVVTVSLTQEETLSLDKGEARIQIRWITSNGHAAASPIKTVNIAPILMDGVITYGD